MSRVKRLLWRDLSPRDDWCLVARTVIGRISPGGFHTHDFSELFWVEEGEGRHAINGADRPLVPGALCFIRAGDRHSLHGGPGGITITNVAFRPGLVEEAVARLGGPAALAYPASRRAAPRTCVLPALAREELAAVFRQFAGKPRDRFAVEVFLLRAMQLGGSQIPPQGGLAPAWLLRAVERTRLPEHFRRGVPAFVELAGRSAEHVARETRRHFACTPGELVNRARLDHAAGLLELTAVNITELALDCGFQSLSHFIRLFRARFGEPPLRYRRRRWGLA